MWNWFPCSIDPIVHAMQNFGGNQQFHPKQTFEPDSESELLEILNRLPGQRFRAAGRLHSWSGVVVADDVLISLNRMDHVRVDASGDEPTADVGAGCQIKRLIAQLAEQGGWTLPSLGLINEQTIAGATATATHGSGRHCLSHYLVSVRLACFDPHTGQAVMRSVASGDELRAARCSLGCLGIITSVRVRIRRQYNIEEHFRRYPGIQEILDAEDLYPLQQSYLIPWRWDLFAQHRREVSAKRSRLAWLYRLYWSVGMDVGLHLIVRLLVRWLPRGCTPVFFRRVLPLLVPRGWKVVDRSDRQLTMEHELFRHIETEVFVRRPDLADSLELTRRLLSCAAGYPAELSAEERQIVEQHDPQALTNLRGSYQHHYPICIRKVLPDETLIGMASGGDVPWYAISIISYAKPDQRRGFFGFAEIFVRLLMTRFGGRPHWGKHCPADRQQLDRAYQRLPQFRDQCQQFDPTGRFRNAWTSGRLLPSNTELTSSQASDPARQ